MNERLAKENILYPENASIIDCFARVCRESLEQTANKSTITGEVKYTLLLNSDGDFTTVDIPLPFRYEFDSEAHSIYDARVNVISSRARQDSETIGIDAELDVSAWGSTEEKIKAVNEVRIGEKINRKTKDVIICYLGSEDSAWTVAKKYHISLSDLKAKNKNDSKDYYII